MYEQVKDYFPEIIDVEFTVNMETLLDKIAEGDIGWRKVIDNFYGSFKLDVARRGRNGKVEIKDEPAGEDCEVCGAPMVIKWDVMVNLWRARISQIVEIQKLLLKLLVSLVQNAKMAM